jgi:RHS repeat-associated protein
MKANPAHAKQRQAVAACPSARSSAQYKFGWGKLPLLFLTTLLLLLGNIAFAGQIEYNQYVNKVNLSIGSTFVLSDPTWADEAATPADFAAFRENQVRLVYSRDQKTDIDGNAWKYTITYTISFVGQNLAPVQDQLVVEHGTGIHNYAAAKVYRPGAHTILVRIDNIQTTGGTVPADVRLELATVTERYQQLNVSAQPSLQYDATTKTLFWNHIPGAESYDVEWSWMDDLGNATADPFERAIRVHVSGHSIQPDWTYREGEVHCRVRPVGRFINVQGEYYHRRNGAWSATEIHVIDGSVTTQNPFEPDLNLAYQTTFAEDGKFKKVMQYVDGTGKPRQSLTHLNSDQTTVVTQTEYDHEGRGVLMTLPVPIPGIDLGYVEKLNRRNANDPYRVDEFDGLGTSLPDPMHIASGASQYYSVANPFTNTINQDYIPDAGGYPFTQVEYMRDATGRVARQGGVGAQHQLGTGHETRYFYGNASETELHMMFGGDVGESSHYLKKMSIDPNGQVSFAWQDQEERVIATALAGDAPENVQALDNISTYTLEENLQDRSLPGEGAVLNTLDHTFLNEYLGQNYSFEWNLVGVVGEIMCDICYDCTYELEIYVVGPDGDSVTLNGRPYKRIHEIYAPSSPTHCAVMSMGYGETFSLTANQLGSYRIYKTLKVVPPNPAVLLDAINQNRANCASYPNYTTILNGLIAAIDPEDCAPEPCTTAVPIYEKGFGGTVSGYSNIDCNPAFAVTASDVIGTECEGIYQRMVADIAPGGWLHNQTVWAQIGNNPASIRSYLTDPMFTLNGGVVHREACLYQACIDDAVSRTFDIQMAASPDYTFAELHHYIPSTNMGTDLWDPWFVAHPTLQADMVDLLFGNSPADYLGSGVGMLDYYSTSSPNAAISGTNGAYATQCGTAACQDALRWRLTVGGYQAEKTAVIVQYNINTRGCTYYNDVHAIVPNPLVPTHATSNPDDFHSGVVASTCNINCEGSVAGWMALLDQQCPDLALPAHATDRAAVEAALFDFCLGSCQDGNPMALLTDAMVTNGELSAVEAIMATLGVTACTDAVENIAIADAYVWDDGNGTTYEDDCTIWDPALIAVMDAVTNNWTIAPATTIPIDPHTVLAQSFPGSTALSLNGAVLELVGGAGCEALVLMDCNGPINLSNVKQLRFPVYDGALPGCFTYTGSGTFQDVRMEVVLHGANNTETTTTGWLFSDCGTYTVTQGTCAYPILSTAPITPPVYPADPYADCIAGMEAQATYQANLIFQSLMDDLLDEALAQATALCRQKPPLYEEFKMVHAPKVYQYTLYYFDQAGNIVQTVPPEGVELLSPAVATLWDNGVGNRATDMPAHRLKTRYAYNSLELARKSSTPDGGEQRNYYDSKDRLRLSQNARQLQGDDYTYVKYDALGRAVESGQIEACSCTVDLALLDDASFPDRSAKTLTDIVTTSYDLPYDPAFAADNLRTRVAAVTREDTEADMITKQLYSYDDHGNVQRYRTELVGFGTFDLEYRYDMVSGKVNQTLYQNGKPDYFSHRFSYDADNRLTKAETTRDNVFWDRDGRYFYYPHGPLARLEIGQDIVQGEDHYYTVHGWVKGVNMPDYKTVSHDPGHDGQSNVSGLPNRWSARDAASYSLGYYSGDYDDIGSATLGILGNAWSQLSPHIRSLPNDPMGLYNGNIAMMVTDLKMYGAGGSSGGLGVPEAQAYAYQYDQLHRLKQMRSHHYTFAAGWTRTGGGTGPGYYDSDYSYDANGNIESLSRRMPDQLPNSTLGTKWMDQMTYHYTLSAGEKVHNKLGYVTDGAPAGNHDLDLESQSSGNYQYDAIGQLIADQSEDISAITWDVQNKVRQVIRDNNPGNLPELAFWYNATGERVRKRMTVEDANGDPLHHDEWYVRDPQGNEVAVYQQYIDDETLYTALKEHAIYGIERLGLDLNGLILSQKDLSNGEETELPDPSGRSASPLVIGEIFYDSPKTPGDAVPGEEAHEGEYIVLINTSDKEIDLADHTLEVDGVPLVLDFTIPAHDRRILAHTSDPTTFGQLVYLPSDLLSKVVAKTDLELPDRGAYVALVDPFGVALDAFPYGAFYGLETQNAYVPDSLIDSLDLRESLLSVQRRSYGGPISIGGGVIAGDLGEVGDIEPGIDPEPTTKPTGGKYNIYRGRKAYELKNHLGNVLAVVSDVKIGIRDYGNTSAYLDYYDPDVMQSTDYEPFGMPLVGRQYVASDVYRYSFNGKENDDEWNGRGNMLDFGARVHDPRLGRFLSLDPLAGKYAGWSPYVFVMDNPIHLMDPDGREPVQGCDPRPFPKGSYFYVEDYSVVVNELHNHIVAVTDIKHGIYGLENFKTPGWSHGDLEGSVAFESYLMSFFESKSQGVLVGEIEDEMVNDRIYIALKADVFDAEFIGYTEVGKTLEEQYENVKEKGKSVGASAGGSVKGIDLGVEGSYNQNDIKSGSNSRGTNFSLGGNMYDAKVRLKLDVVIVTEDLLGIQKLNYQQLEFEITGTLITPADLDKPAPEVKRVK